MAGQSVPVIVRATTGQQGKGQCGDSEEALDGLHVGEDNSNVAGRMRLPLRTGVTAHLSACGQLLEFASVL